MPCVRDDKNECMATYINVPSRPLQIKGRDKFFATINSS